jgi:hypothetical protein
VYSDQLQRFVGRLITKTPHPTSQHPETNRLKRALENATPESYAEFNAKYAIIWEDSY